MGVLLKSVNFFGDALYNCIILGVLKKNANFSSLIALYYIQE